jgi:glycosyltransferase involved in cell wall biosynthesis
MPALISRMRFWDRLAADRVDHFVANSQYVQRRIKKYYQRDSEIIHPPVYCSKFHISPTGHENFYLAGGRLIPYKKFDLVIKAFNDLKNEKLIIFGSGPELKNLKKLAGPNVEFIGKVDDKKLQELFSKCKAFIFPQEEDFGIVAVEAMASGRPVIAYRKGGSLETVREGITGAFFNEQTPQSLIDTITRFQPDSYKPETIRQHALQFDVIQFKKKFLTLLEDKWEEWKKTMR